MRKLKRKVPFDLSKNFLSKEEEKFFPLIISVFILSIFIGILLTVTVRKWLVSNFEVVQKIQAQEESRRIEKLFDKFDSQQ